MSANDPICAAIVGLGRWGQNLMAAATNAPDHPLRFVQGVTRTPSKAAEFTKHHGIPVSDDYDAMLEDPAIQAVVLATPHSQHCDQICKAANAGKHVFVEKPLALTFDEARRAIDTCNNQGVTLAVGFNRRFLPAFQELYNAHGRRHFRGSATYRCQFLRTVWLSIQCRYVAGVSVGKPGGRHGSNGHPHA